jgi:uncharacterized membrane protein
MKTWRLVMLALIAGYVVTFTGLSYAKFSSFNSSTIDLAIYIRSLWGILNGTFTDSMSDNNSIWASHWEPGILLLALFAKVIPPVWVLLISQSVALGATAWILFRYAETMVTPLLALLLGLSVLLHPAMQNANLSDFHMLPICVPFLGLFSVAVAQDQPKKATFALLLGLLFREEIAGILFLWGIHRALRSKREGAGLIVVSLTWVLISYLLKYRYSSAMNYLFEQLLATNTSRLGLFDTWATKFKSLLWLVAGFAFLPLLSAKAAKNLIWYLFPFVVHFSSPHLAVMRIDFYYLSFYVPPLACLTVAIASKYSGRKWVPAILFLCVSMTSYWNTMAPWGRSSSLRAYQSDHYAEEAAAIVKRIGINESVSAPLSIVAHLAERRWVYWKMYAGPDEVIVELSPTLQLGETPEELKSRMSAMRAFEADLVHKFGYSLDFEGRKLRLYKKPASS